MRSRVDRLLQGRRTLPQREAATLRAINPNDTGKQIVGDLSQLLTALDLQTIEDLNDYCEDALDFSALVRINPDGYLEIISFITNVGTGLEFPFSVEFFYETLDEIEEEASRWCESEE